MKNLLALIVMISTMNLVAQNMTTSKLEKLIEKTADSISQHDDKDHWYFTKENCLLICVTDSSMNRMRVLSPIVEVSKLEPKYFKRSLRANFHSVLDVKYAISDGYMWSIYIHPLKELSDEQFLNAVSQVVEANKTFGTTFKSSSLHFKTLSKENLDNQLHTDGFDGEQKAKNL